MLVWNKYIEEKKGEIHQLQSNTGSFLLFDPFSANSRLTACETCIFVRVIATIVVSVTLPAGEDAATVVAAEAVSKTRDRGYTEVT